MTEKLAYSTEYQTQVLAYMAHDPHFAEFAKTCIEEEHFSDRSLQWFFRELCTCSNLISVGEALAKEARKPKGLIKVEERAHYVDIFKQLKVSPPANLREHIRDSVGKFVRSQNVKRAILDSINNLETGNWADIEASVVAAVHSGIDASDSGQDYFQDYEERLKRRLEEQEFKRYPTGIPGLDEATSGGLKSKQLGMIVGGTGRGKSIFLEWLVQQAIIRGKKTVYFTLEMAEDDVAARFDSLFCEITPQDLPVLSEDVENILEGCKAAHGSSLFIKEYPADTATVHTLKAYIKQLHNNGIYPEVIAVDYLDLLKPHRFYHDATQELDAITKALHGLAKELDVAIWTATQLNRAGLVNDHPDETSIAGAVAKIFTCDLVCFLACNAEERAADQMRILVNKNRNGRAGKSIAINTNYSIFKFYDSDLVDDDVCPIE